MAKPAGLLLAAGAGTRMGRPKALVRDEDGNSWLHRSIEVLRDGGCEPVIVVLGAGADQARSLVPDGVEVVLADDWATGMAASLRAGLSAAEATAADAVVVHLVDLPDVGADVIDRVARSASGAGRSALARAAYDGVPGHPVVLGRAHWAAVAELAVGDSGARPYLAAHDVEGIECGDLARGRDVDQPPANGGPLA
ncbi:nucleotidyltransferase family protein [Nocardioides sp. GXZ039]|uniref:nucleotidyltransferase family protein n=1 Tax=Nocardioides sp. GXZ039 TaxID=3136018 RepID=UPI0030F43F0B